MEFYDVLDQILDLLRRRGRMSYRASGPTPGSFWQRSIAGSPKDLIRETSRTPKR
jgi:hypothetical protein